MVGGETPACTMPTIAADWLRIAYGNKIHLSLFLQIDLHKIAKSMNFYHDINSGTFLNIRSHRLDGSSPNHTYIVRIVV